MAEMQIRGSQILAGTITNTQISASAAIDWSKMDTTGHAVAASMALTQSGVTPSSLSGSPLQVTVSQATFGNSSILRFENVSTNANSAIRVDFLAGDVGGGTYNYGSIQMRPPGATDPTFQIGSGSTCDMTFFTSGGERMRLKQGAYFLSFGGQTTSFPASKRESANWAFRLGDDSDYTGIIASKLYAGGTNVWWEASGTTILKGQNGSGYADLDVGLVTANAGFYQLTLVYDSTHKTKCRTDSNGTLIIGNNGAELITLAQNMGGGTTYGGWEYIDTNRHFGLQGPTGKGVAIFTNGGSTTPDLFVNSSGGTELTGKATKYNGISTAGWGVPAIYGSARAAAQTAAVASVVAYTVGAADGTFRVCANVLVTTSTTHNFTVAVAYTDQGNTARTLTLSFTLVAGGALVTAIDNANGAVPYMGIAQLIRCKASTSITIKTVAGTFTTVTYDVDGLIEQVA